MPLFPYSYKKVSDKTRVRVSNHFYYSDFGVLEGRDTRQYGRRYICTGTPGTGFIERDSESHSYHEFVRDYLTLQRPSYFRLLTGREPNYDRELMRANEALHAEADKRKKQILECYANALTVGRQEEMMQRCIRGIKNKMGHHSNKYMVSLISHYKRKIQQLEKDIASVELNVTDGLDEAQSEAYARVCETFVAMANKCRRIWNYREESSGVFKQVFFDMGIFDFIRSKHFLPLMRDVEGVCYYLLPDALLKARSSVDFDLIPLKNLTIVWQEMAMQEPTQLLSDKLIDAACMIQMPGIGLTFYFNHARVVIDFVQAMDALKATL